MDAHRTVKTAAIGVALLLLPVVIVGFVLGVVIGAFAYGLEWGRTLVEETWP